MRYGRFVTLEQQAILNQVVSVGPERMSAAPCFKETLEPGDHGDNRR
jgi:hypothetical protein